MRAGESLRQAILVALRSVEARSCTGERWLGQLSGPRVSVRNSLLDCPRDALWAGPFSVRNDSPLQLAIRTRREW